MIPELDLERIRRWADQRVPPHARHQVRLEIETNAQAVTVVERRAPWREDFGPQWSRLPIARLRYTKSRGHWTLYWRDRNLKFHRYDLLEPTTNVTELLAEIDRDPTGIFWG
jgi:hypothetical protein